MSQHQINQPQNLTNNLSSSEFVNQQFFRIEVNPLNLDYWQDTSVHSASYVQWIYYSQEIRLLRCIYTLLNVKRFLTQRAAKYYHLLELADKASISLLTSKIWEEEIDRGLKKGQQRVTRVKGKGMREIFEGKEKNRGLRERERERERERRSYCASACAHMCGSQSVLGHRPVSLITSWLGSLGCLGFCTSRSQIMWLGQQMII